MVYGLRIGEIIKRTDLHERFGGQRQGGISTPSGVPLIMLFTGSNGEQHGYSDGWHGDVFCYFGEGQVGAMEFRRGNLAIRDHLKDHKDLLLFSQTHKAYVKFLGSFVVGSWQYSDAPDRNGAMRPAIVFHLSPATETPDEIEEPRGSGTSIGTLRDAARQSGSAAPPSTTKTAAQTYITRSQDVRRYALARAEGRCELCEAPAPFATSNGNPFLEVHHIFRLTDGGPDLPDAVAALCPNCHRRCHYGHDAAEVRTKLSTSISRKEVDLERCLSKSSKVP